MRTTIIHEVHLRAGARMGEFAGWSLPMDYGGVLREVQAVRTAAGLFDVSHMGRLEIFGADAADTLQRLLTNDLSRLSDGGGQYTLMCNPDGGVTDDLIVFRMAADRFYLVVNASNLDKDKAWITRNLPGSAVLEDCTLDTAMFALQGPRAEAIMVAAGMPNTPNLSRFHFAWGDIADNKVLVLRTGYTGEDGFEIVCRSESAEAVWNALIAAGGNHGLTLCGLAARDVLRIEAALPLYGHEIDEHISPVEAGLMRWVKLEKGDFVGRKPIAELVDRGPSRKLIGVDMAGRFVPRAGDTVSGEQGQGVVASGTFSPTLGVGIAMAYMPPDAEAGTPVEVMIHDKPRHGVLRKLPFCSRKRL
ncbi:MAG: glycine cleavage system aminomethyltransferase GcvT [Armatimonadetes bacterium]|nr:glycine cleavage system aminomethyltransferase GcvT [Armatimonadota bacterium]